MRFALIDRIVELEPGRKITAVKALSMAEEYLADHFPNFPVMPGVLMLEAMTQAGAWLVRVSEGFAHSMVLLSEAANLKYGQFVEPGQVLTVTAEIVSQDERETRLKALGKINGQLTVGARLTLKRYNLAETDPTRAGTDRALIAHLRQQLRLIYQAPEAPKSNGQPAIVEGQTSKV